MPEDSSTSTRMIGSEGEERTPVGKGEFVYLFPGFGMD